MDSLEGSLVRRRIVDLPGFEKSHTGRVAGFSWQVETPAALRIKPILIHYKASVRVRGDCRGGKRRRGKPTLPQYSVIGESFTT